ncbi:MAG: GlsB/YeaQ/YmgE family stress response membrane protein [Mycobacteriales bacterium]
MGAFFGLLFTGLVVGLLGRLVVPGRQPIGFVRTLLVGVGGALAGGYLGKELFSFGGLGRFVLAVLVAALLVVLIEGAAWRSKRWS